MAFKIFGLEISLSKDKEVNTMDQEREMEILQEELMKKEMELSSSEQTVEMPIGSSSRSSVPEAANTFLPNSLTPISIDFPFKLLVNLENLQVFNRHISYAVENIITLGNTKHSIKFSEDVSDEQKVQMQEHLDSVCGSWYEFSDGTNGLINDLLVQLATYGCISAERIPHEDLSGIKKIVRVNPVNIRFTYDKEEDSFNPIQQSIGLGVFQTNSLGYIRLNKATYSYLAMKRYKTSPIATPPFFSAIEDLLVEEDMLKSFKNMMKRIGMLGFLSVMVTAPKHDDGESDDTYRIRVQNYLNDVVVPQAERQFSKGVAVGYKGHADFNVEAGNSNVQGAEGLMSIIKKLIFSGVKQDPSMHGENFSTTETFARVILNKMSKQIQNYQNTVANFLEICYMQELVLAGFSPGTIKVEFEKPMVNDKLKDLQAENSKFDLYKKQYDQGLIDQTQFAQALGHKMPSQEQPRVQVINNGNEQPNQEDAEEELSKLKKNLKAHLKEYDYEIPHSYGRDSYTSLIDVTDFEDNFINGQVKSYISEVAKAFNSSISSAARSLNSDLSSLNETSSLEQVQELILTSLLRRWEENFSERVVPIAQSHLESIYGYYRSREDIFTDARGFDKKQSFFDIPESVFSTIDFAAIEYLQNIDSIWLGKFITDEDTINRINLWVQDAFENGEVPVANNQNTERFIQAFEDQVGLESWKIRRIIETTVNKARSYSSVMYIDQAGIQQFEVVEIIDSKTCDYCRHMNGMILEVQTAVENLQRLVDQPVQNISEITPFATTIRINEFQNMDASQLQASGINTPSYHPHCRGRILAVI